MPLRPYKPEDSLALATIKAQCDLADPLALYCRTLDANVVRQQQQQEQQQSPIEDCHGQYQSSQITSHRKWRAHIKSLQKSLELEILLPGTVCWIVTEGDHTNQSCSRKTTAQEKMVGFAIWNRHGDSSVAKKWKSEGQSISTRIKHIFAYIQMTFTYPFDTSINHPHKAKFIQRIRQAPTPLSPPHEKLPRERWELEALYISPSHQRRGYGTEALLWGQKVAQEENVEIWIWSSDAGKSLYLKGGFEVVGSIEFGDLVLGSSAVSLRDCERNMSGGEDDCESSNIWIMVWTGESTTTVEGEWPQS